jgi:hypothetical protein
MRARLLSLFLLLALGLACQSSPPPAARVPTAATDRAEAFEAQRAWGHLAALAEIGPRAMGTEGARRAGDFILAELAKLELEVFEQSITVRRAEEDEAPIPLRNIAAKIPGHSSDIFLLAAPYDTRLYESFRFLGVNDGGSGAALLLEITRVLASDPLPYTTWVVFLDGEAPLAPGGVATAPPSFFGSRGLSERLRELQVLPGIRLGLVVNRVCDADLRVARDLLSHRMYREEFWRAAARLGRTDAFPPDAGFESPVASHQALVSGGLRRVVALVDTSFGGDEPPGLYAGTEDDDLEHCSADSLEAVGQVSLEALDTIARRLAKIDRFAASPLEATGELTFEPAPAPQAEDAAAAEPEGEAADAQPGAEAASSQPGQDAPSSQAGAEEASPEPDAGEPSSPAADEAAISQPGEDAPSPSAAEGEGEPAEPAPEAPPANPEAPEASR